MPTRTLSPSAWSCSPIAPPDGVLLRAWLLQHAPKVTGTKPAFLLVHSEEGVFWGEVSDDDVHTARHTALAHAVPLLDEKPEAFADYGFQELRLFGGDGEILLWHDGDALHARLIVDGTRGGATEGESYDESVLLWGTQHHDDDGTGFVWYREGPNGLAHALPPRAFSAKATDQPPRLKVRHYVEAAPLARVVASRLVGFESPF